MRSQIIADLSTRIGLAVCTRPFDAVAGKALAFTWTRDPFDRLLVAQAALEENLLLSADQTIRAHYPHTRWE